MSVFLQWNDALAARFFKPESAGQPVWLDVSHELVQDTGRGLSLGGVPEFVAAMKGGPPWSTPAGLCQRALKTCEGWRARNLTYPPYVGYLALFVLAAGLEGVFAPHAYYPRLRTLLGEPPTTGALSSFDHMYELWDDLERWSVRDRNGDLGLIQARIAGGMFHIGLPLGQSLLAEEDRRALPAIFARAQLDPSSSLPDAELLRALRSHGAGLLRSRTSRLLEGTGDRDVLNALIDLVADELSEWNGEVGVQGTGSGARPEVLAGLRLCMRLDRVAGRSQTTLRCTLNRRDFPEDGLSFSVVSVGKVTADEEIPGWSAPLTESASGVRLDGARFDWLAGLSVVESRLGWRFRLPPRGLRVLVPGDAVGLSGLVEVHQVQRRQAFYILFHEREWSHIEHWTRESCEGFELLGIRDGLPAAWRLATCAGITRDDDTIADRYPVLARPERVSLRLAGGIRSAAGSSFFAFAPPRVVLEGGKEEAFVRCDGEALSAGPDGTSYELPANLPLETRTLIEVVTSGGAVLKRQSLYLTGEFTWNRPVALEVFDAWGQPEAESDREPRVAGACAFPAGDVPTFRRPVLLAPGLAEHLDRRVFFIGRVPGEIAAWPAEPLPGSWEPVWAVPMVRRGVALYCGRGLDESSPLPAQGLEREQTERWRDILWYRRKRIAPPPQRRLAELWRLYSESARHA